MIKKYIKDYLANVRLYFKHTRLSFDHILFVKICQFSYFSSVVALGCVRRSHDLELKLCFFGIILSPYRALRICGERVFLVYGKEGERVPRLSAWHPLDPLIAIRYAAYQISTRSSGAMYIESPSWTPNAV